MATPVPPDSDRPESSEESSFDGPLSDRKRQQGVRARISSFQMPAGIQLISILDIRPPTKSRNMPALQPKRLHGRWHETLEQTLAQLGAEHLDFCGILKQCLQLTQFSLNFPWIKCHQNDAIVLQSQIYSRQISFQNSWKPSIKPLFKGWVLTLLRVIWSCLS